MGVVEHAKLAEQRERLRAALAASWRMSGRRDSAKRWRSEE